MKAVLECASVRKVYGEKTLAQTVLDNVSFSMVPGDCAALLGPSGSGKTTLLSILGCLLTPTEGTLTINGMSAFPKSVIPLTEFRRRYVGFVFQQAQLLPFLSVEENLSVVAKNSDLASHDRKGRIDILLDRLGMSEHRRKRPGELSGGQRQRVAIARSLLHRPAVLLADEPTAALDRKNGEAAVDLLLEEARAESTALLVVTHDTRLVRKFDRVFHIENGRLEE
ncbi:ABC transporter ATP-binding protein [bacterium]|nr:ABC transporter ATP-binding protein [bacterium]